MKDNIRIAIEFAESIKNIKGILQIILFGSVALGEDKPSSDIDIAIIHNRKDKFDLMKEANRFKHEKIQTVFININELYKETELIGALSGEGLILYGRPIKLNANKLGLKEKIFLIYNMSKLKQNEKVKLNRALFGSISKSYGEKKTYITKTKGLINEPGIEKLAKGCILVDRNKSYKLINLFKRFNVDHKKISIWTY